jgi:hypothetical protein
MTIKQFFRGLPYLFFVWILSLIILGFCFVQKILVPSFESHREKARTGYVAPQATPEPPRNAVYPDGK